jgi:hypothetical protein
VKSEPGPPMTLGNSAAARIRLIVWYLPFGEPHDFAGYKACGHDIEPVPAEMARRYGPDAPTRVAHAARLFSLRTPRYGYGRDRRRRREEARAGAPPKGALSASLTASARTA